MKQPLLYSSLPPELVIAVICFAIGFLVWKSWQARPLAATQLPYRWATFLAYSALFSCLLIRTVEFALVIKYVDWLHAVEVATLTAVSLVAGFGILARRKFGVVAILISMLIDILQSLFTETDVQRIVDLSVLVLFVIPNIVYFRKRWRFLTGVPPASPAPPSPM